MREAGGEIERAVRPDGADRTGRDAELAFEAGVVVDRMVVVVDFDIDEHGAQQHEVAEFRMDQVAVNAHVAEPSLDRDRLVRDDPRRVARLIHLHGEAHGGIDGANVARLELGDDVCADLVDLVARSMEFEIGDRSRRTAHRFARHAHDKAEQRPGPGIVAEDLVALRIEAGAVDFDEAEFGTAIERQLAKPRRIDRRRRARFRPRQGSQRFTVGMVFEFMLETFRREAGAVMEHLQRLRPNDLKLLSR